MYNPVPFSVPFLSTPLSAGQRTHFSAPHAGRRTCPCSESSPSSGPVQDGGDGPRQIQAGETVEERQMSAKAQGALRRALYANWGDAPTHCQHLELGSQTMIWRWCWGVLGSRSRFTLHAACLPCCAFIRLHYLHWTREPNQTCHRPPRVSWIKSQNSNRQSCLCMLIAEIAQDPVQIPSRVCCSYSSLVYWAAQAAAILFMQLTNREPEMQNGKERMMYHGLEMKWLNGLWPYPGVVLSTYLCLLNIYIVYYGIFCYTLMKIWFKGNQ